MASKVLRSSTITPPNVKFPLVQKFSARLPTYGEVIGVLRNILEEKTSNVPTKEAMETVADMIYSKYHHDTVYCIGVRGIQKRLEKDWEIFKKGKRRFNAGRSTGCEIENYKKLTDKADKLYDVAATEKSQKDQCVAEWGVIMGSEELAYLEDQRTLRLQECDNQVDPVWWSANERGMKELERMKMWQAEKGKQFSRDTTLDDIDMEDDDTTGEGCSNDQEYPYDQQDEHRSLYDTDLGDDEVRTADPKKRRMFSVVNINSDDDRLPSDLRHVRTSERAVRDEIYQCLADLEGFGLSSMEAQKAIVRVAELFERKWKLLADNEDNFDIDTLPHERNIRIAARQIEAQGISCMVKELWRAKGEGRMITHATDSTTKKGIGQFAASGIHIGKNVPFPLPLIPVCGESTNDIAEQCSLMFEILAVVDDLSHEDLYKELVDTHMTDSTEHNKGFAARLAEMYNLDTVKGQLFCGTHTTLGFSRAMNIVLAAIERDMTLEAIFNNFMIDLDFDSKHGSVGGQACDVILRLVAPEFLHKPWNYHESFLKYLRDRSAELVLFDYKDQRFGCLSRACAVIVYIKTYLVDWLDENPDITNRLACLVRDFLEIEYLDVAFSVFAAYGIHLVEPFFATTINTDATHSSLKDFYQGLYGEMSKPVNETFFKFSTNPWFSAIAVRTHYAVKESYTLDVVSAVEDMANEHMQQCIQLANLIMPEARKVLGRQRRDYNLSEEFQPEYPIEKQAPKSDDTPVHNLGMERVCGKTDYRAKKLKQLDAVSRSMILDATGQLRKDYQDSFRKFRKEAEEIRDLKIKRSQKMKDRFAAKLTEKQAVAVNKEEKRLLMLEKLKKCGGPFTTSDQVDAYLTLSRQREESALNAKEKAKITKEVAGHMKLELKYARDSSTTLPKSDPIFRIQISTLNQNRRDKTAEEFGVSLKAFYGKKAGKVAMSLDQFTESLNNVSAK